MPAFEALVPPCPTNQANPTSLPSLTPGVDTCTGDKLRELGAWYDVPTECNFVPLGSVCLVSCLGGSQQGSTSIDATCELDASFTPFWTTTDDCVPPSEVRVAVGNKTWLLMRPGDISADVARKACVARGGDLLTIRSAEENNILVQEMVKWFGTEYSDAYIGAVVSTDKLPENVKANWRWLTTNTPLAYANWFGGAVLDDGSPLIPMPVLDAGRCGVVTIKDKIIVLPGKGVIPAGTWANLQCDDNTDARGTCCQLGECQWLEVAGDQSHCFCPPCPAPSIDI